MSNHLRPNPDIHGGTTGGSDIANFGLDHKILDIIQTLTWGRVIPYPPVGQPISYTKTKSANESDFCESNFSGLISPASAFKCEHQEQIAQIGLLFVP